MVVSVFGEVICILYALNYILIHPLGEHFNKGRKKDHLISVSTQLDALIRPHEHTQLCIMIAQQAQIQKDLRLQ